MQLVHILLQVKSIRETTNNDRDNCDVDNYIYASLSTAARLIFLSSRLSTLMIHVDFATIELN